MTAPRFLLPAVIVLLGGPGATGLSAAVVVISNRADSKVSFEIAQSGTPAQEHSLDPGETMPIPIRADVKIAFDGGDGPVRYTLRSNSIYCFTRSDSRVALQQYPLESPPTKAAPKAAGAPSAAQPGSAPAHAKGDGQEGARGVIRVMLLVDDDEPTVRGVWEKRLRERLAAASEIFERSCRIRFEAVAAGTWESDKAITDFIQSARELAMKVMPAPAQVAIGFTSQYAIRRNDTHLGATRGLFDSHVLIRERSPSLQEPERLEVLVHELGHLLGAAHSADANSVMRPKMADRRSRARSFHIGFDPLNSLIMNLVADEFRARGVLRLDQMSPETKVLLRGAYTALATALPEDKAATESLARLDALPPTSREMPIRIPEPVVLGVRTVLLAIRQAAAENHRLPPQGSNPAAGSRRRLEGDRLAEMFFRQAADAARRLPPPVASEAYLVGLGIGLDDSPLLHESPILGRLWREWESDEDRNARLAVLGSPAMRGRRDSAQHFVVSAALAALIHPAAAETIGVLKEIRDAQGGSGFSFVDLQSDLAGVEFATRLSRSQISLERLARSFAVDDFLPEPGGLGEGLSWGDFLAAYGSMQDERFRRQREAIRQRILSLRGYRDR